MFNKSTREKYEEVMRCQLPRVRVENDHDMEYIYNSYGQMVALRKWNDSIAEFEYYVSEVFYHDYVLDSVVTRK